ncbi:MAG: hypothetical protein K8R86_04885 [Bacteroidales bacterium]|nr:hypothetical protein [Bacteroidales bacterium]
MKHRFTILFMFFIVFGFSQTPELVNYQAVIRDSVGQILSNQQIDFQLSILKGGTTGLSVYQEVHSVTTNDFGQIAIQIGGGTTTSGNFSTINWGDDEFYIEIAIDTEGQGSFTIMGTSQLVSVPYALNSKRTESFILTDQNGNQYELWVDSLGNIGTYPAYQYGEPCPGMPSINYHGQTYYTIKIGNQCWLRENLNIGTMINGIEDMQDNDTIEKYCYEDIAENCETYGGLYQWDELMQYTNIEGSQGICPNGWHIPSHSEFNVLTDFLSGDTIAGGKLKTIGTIEEGTGLWHTPNLGATNESGFSVLPAGNRRPGYYFEHQGNRGYFWTSTEFDIDHVWYRRINFYNEVLESNENTKEKGFSVRCIRDQSINQQPDVPASPDPADGSTGIIINSSLNWTCSDPENDLLSYDVYFGTTNPPTIINSGQTETSFDPGILTYNETYYWKIVAHDQFNTTDGPIWSFTTVDPPTNGLEAYYPFNGNANDESGNGIHGVVNGPVLCQDRFNNQNSAYYYNGIDNHILIGDYFDENEELSIISWVLLDENSIGENYLSIISKHQNAGGFNEKSFNMNRAGANLQEFRVRFYDTDSLVECIDPSIAELNKWTLLVTTFSYGDVKLYKDGVVVDSNEVASLQIQNTSTPVLIGDNYSNDHPFHGIIDEIRIYSRALTETEIQGFYSE